MRYKLLFLVVLLLPTTALLFLLLGDRDGPTNYYGANSPPRGWNSYDSYSWIISEHDFLHNAELVSKRLLPYGYEDLYHLHGDFKNPNLLSLAKHFFYELALAKYVVIDFLWYRRRDPGSSAFSPGFDTIDEWGRPIPDPERWPSSIGGVGLKKVAEKVHALGLKFGIHVMRGISAQAVSCNTPILGANGSPYPNSGRPWCARDIALQNETCPWMPTCFMSVNESTEGGRAFIQSLYDLYASWDVDFVKHDCVFGMGDLSVHEIKAVSQAINASGRPMIYSISPGVQADPKMAAQINSFVNMYRITGDDWDSWHAFQLHFDAARDFAAAGLIGAPGLHGAPSWPDLDMLPLGYLTDPGANQGPHRFCTLMEEEQKTQVTLWAMAKSPLMFGGDMLSLDEVTFSLITNPTVLEINANSYGNMEIGATNIGQQALPIISVTNCRNANATSWVFSGRNRNSTNQLCGAISPGTKGSKHALAQSVVCLDWMPFTIISTMRDEKDETVANMMSNNKGFLGTMLDEATCLDSQASQKLTLKSFISQHFSPCSLHKMQIWTLDRDGILMNEASGLCAAVMTEGSLQNETNTRIWSARGLNGKYYVAFFNLGLESTTMSILVEDVILALNKGGISDSKPTYNCSGQEVWSAQDLGILRNVLSFEVVSHGCALFSLQCTI